jgi:hypothetical protein
MVLKEKDDQQKEEPEVKEEKGANELVKRTLIVEEKSDSKVGQTIELSTDEPTSINTTTTIIENTSSAPSNIGNFTSSSMKPEVETTSSSSPSSIIATPNNAANGTNNGTVASAGKEEASNVGEAKEEPHTDLETFLRSANLSSQHTAQFMRLLETEVARRLESHLTKEGGQQANNSSVAAATLSDSVSEFPYRTFFLIQALALITVASRQL